MFDPREQAPDHGPPFKDLRRQLDFLLGLTQAVCAPAELWLRQIGSFGSRYFGWHLAVGYALMLIGPLLAFPRADPRPLFAAVLATLGLQILHRAKGAWDRRTSPPVHSRYSGRPQLMRLFGNEVEIKERYEPGLLIAVGIAVCLVNAPLGSWCIFAGLCLGFSVGWNSDRDRAKVQSMIAAKLEADYYAERFRREMGE